jgi:hypothetical protein
MSLNKVRIFHLNNFRGRPKKSLGWTVLRLMLLIEAQALSFPEARYSMKKQTRRFIQHPAAFNAPES